MNTSKLKLHVFNAALWRQVPDSVCATKQNKTTQRAFGGCFAAGHFTPVFICSDQELSIDTGRELCTKG